MSAIHSVHLAEITITFEKHLSVLQSQFTIPPVTIQPADQHIVRLVLQRNVCKTTNAWFPSFRCRSFVAVSPFPLAVAVSVSLHRCRCRCRCVSFCCLYGCNGTELSYVIIIIIIVYYATRAAHSNSYIQYKHTVKSTEFYNGRTAKRQRKNGNGMMETRHKLTLPP